jgi:class 3 adenylate cyclase/tetratricopeptide (TPR) repeat protein/ABC-type lipoprotein export system ATPase subunit
MSAAVFHFEDFELDRNAYRLSRSGEIVRLERIPLELLFLLIERCGQLVTRDEILERIWGKGVFIDREHAINTAVRKIRRALNDDVNAPRFIVTIPGKGYRFVAPVILNDKLDKNQRSQEPSNGASANFGISRAASVERQLDARGNGHADARSVTGFGERRHLTVLFCDLVNSTSLAAQLDPEEWREIVVNYHRSTSQEVDRFGGYVAQYLGDGVIAYFGWPEAHDDDVERAVRSGLAMLEATSKYSDPSHPRLAARVGIDSGVVVIGPGTGKGADVYGEAPNMAARVQAAAEPGTLLITEAAHRLIPGVFVVEECGAQILKGIPDPVPLYRVIRPSGVRGRLAAAAARGMTPFVGREDELGLLIDRWERTVDSEGQTVLIVGEAGIGKSRLMQRFHEELAHNPHTWLESAAVPFFQNTPFSAVINILQQGFHWESGQSAEQKLAALEASLAHAGVKLAEGVPLLAQIMELPVNRKYPPSSLSAAEQRKRLLASLAAWVFAVAKDHPLLVAIEDLHWADPSTLELIRLLVEQGPRSRLLLLCTARPEFHASWALRAHHTQITLNRLSTRDVREMIAQVAAGNALGADTIKTVIERTSGVPLFIEELMRAVLESGNPMLGEREIPVTLHDSLMARMDRLGPAKDVLQIAAVIGSEFSYDLLHRVHPLADEEFQKALHALVDAELLYVRGIAPDATYQFKHALIRDAAYEVLLKSRRKDLHRLIAQTINERFPTLKNTQPEVLARHWAEAGEIERAVVEWTRAGKAFEARNAFVEAEQSFQHALASLHQLPESPERNARELELKNSQLQRLHLPRGWGAPEAVEAAARMQLLAEKSGDLLPLAVSAAHNCLNAFISGDLTTAAALADKGLELAYRASNPTLMATLHTMQVPVQFYRGDLSGAEKYFASAMKFFSDRGLRQNPHNPVMSDFAHASFTAWIMGRADVARERLTEMRAAVRPANPNDLPRSDQFAAWLHALMRENKIVEALATRALELNKKNGFPQRTSRCWLGYARAQLGRPAEGIALMRQAIDDKVKIRERISVTGLLTYLALAQLRAGAIDEALETAEDALNFNPDELVFRPETLRIRGELQLKQGDRQLAETDFRDSIEMARSMGAKAWELRTTMSRARLLSSQGHCSEARRMLAEIYGWFTEGFDTPDLKDAKALLDELAT